MKQLFLGALCALHLGLFASQNYQLIEDTSDLEILSESLKDRATAKIRLSNGLEAYLVSDPGVEESAAALSVEAGAWNDTKEYPGMAHFLEHMLFMGTEKYPKEDEFLPYIKEIGGKVNAYTASDRTVYMFSANSSAFEGGLDRFSHFFIDPLFKTSSIERELLAVDQEHAKNLENDGWRQYMIFKETGNPNHPNAKFSTGNANTLRGIPREEMIKWYEEHYSADRMHLVILSNLPMQELIDLTVRDFSAIPVREVKKENYSFPMSSEKQKGQKIYISPVKDLKTVSLTWELPQELNVDDGAKAGELIAYILKSGSKNSLLGLLKREHLAEEVSSSLEQLSTTNKLFTIDVAVTEKGLQQIDTVITYCFEALARLKSTGIPRYIYDEVEKISDIQYKYQSREESYLFVMQAAHQLIDESISSYPKKTIAPIRYDPESYRAFLHSLTPDSCTYYITADPSKSGVEMTHKEKWMGAEYAIVPMDKKELVHLSNLSINPQIGLPPPNPFIPNNLELVSGEYTKESAPPQLLEDDGLGKIYFLEDHTYRVPEIAYFFRLKSPLLDGTPKAQVLADFYTKAVNDALFPIISAAEAAGAKILIKPDRFSIAVAISGYSDRSEQLTTDLLSSLKGVKLGKEQFEIYKESLGSAYENSDKDLLFLQVMRSVDSLFSSDVATPSEKKVALSTLRYDEVSDFTKHVFDKTYLEGLVYGNVTKQEGSHLLKNVQKKLKATAFPTDEHFEKSLLLLPEQQGPFMIKHPTGMQGNAALLTIQQGPYSLERKATQQILGSVLENLFFVTLRTEQQVAYIAKAWNKTEENQLLQYFAVQSSSHRPADLLGRFEQFLENFIKKYSTELPPERFETVRDMSIATLKQPPENLAANGVQLFLLGFEYDGDFDLINKRIEALKSVTYEDTRRMANEVFSRQNPRRLALLLEGVTPKEQDFYYETISSEELIQDGRFVTKRESLPVTDVR